MKHTFKHALRVLILASLSIECCPVVAQQQLEPIQTSNSSQRLSMEANVQERKNEVEKEAAFQKNWRYQAVDNSDPTSPRRLAKDRQLLTQPQAAAAAFQTESGPGPLTVTPTCTPIYSNGCAVDNIGSFSLNGGTADVNACSPGAYSIKNNSGFELYQNSFNRFTISTASGSDPQKYQIFVDYNQDGIFTSNELLYQNQNSTTSLTDSFSIPSLPIPYNSPVLMRVISSYTTFGTNTGCPSLFWGETQDYVVNPVLPILYFTNLGSTPSFCKANMLLKYKIYKGGYTGPVGVELKRYYQNIESGYGAFVEDGSWTSEAPGQITCKVPVPTNYLYDEFTGLSHLEINSSAFLRTAYDNDRADVDSDVPPPPKNVSPQARCGSGTLTLTATYISPNVNRWYANNYTRISSPLAVSPSYTPASVSATTRFRVTQGYGVCESDTVSKLLVINTQPVVTNITTADGSFQGRIGQLATFTGTFPVGNGLLLNFEGGSDNAYALIKNGNASQVQAWVPNSCMSGQIVVSNFESGCSTNSPYFTVNRLPGLDWRWVRTATGSGLDRYNKTAFDRLKNTYSVGSFTNYAELYTPYFIQNGFNTLTSAGISRAGFLNKYNQFGNFDWQITFYPTNAAAECEAWDVAMHNDSLYVVGYIKGTVTFQGLPGYSSPSINKTSVGGKDVFIAKYGPNGKLLWVHIVGAASDDEAWDVNVSRTGKVYIAGNFSNSITFSGRPGISGGKAPVTKTSAGGVDAFLLKLTNRGALEWAVGFGGPGNDIAYGIQQDPAQNVYFCGQFSNTATLVPVTGASISLTSAGGTDGFVGQMDFNGVLRWLRRMGGTGNDVCRQIASDKAGNSCVAGSFASSGTTFQQNGLGFNSATLLNTAGGDDAFAASYQSNGDFRWAKRFGGTLSDQGRAVVSDFANNFYLAGYFTGWAADNSGNSLNSANNSQDILFWKLNNNGSTANIQRAGGINTDQGRGLDTCDAGGAMVVGQYGLDAQIGSFGPIPEMGSSGAFLARYGTYVQYGARLGNEEPASVGPMPIAGQLTSYPQPVGRQSEITLNNGLGQPLQAQLVDMQGRCVQQVSLQIGKNTITAPTIPGLYILRSTQGAVRIVVE